MYSNICLILPRSILPRHFPCTILYALLVLRSYYSYRPPQPTIHRANKNRTSHEGSHRAICSTLLLHHFLYGQIQLTSQYKASKRLIRWILYDSRSTSEAKIYGQTIRKDPCGSIWEKTVVAFFGVTYQHLPGVQENHGKC
jgi:hypothetical protein